MSMPLPTVPVTPESANWRFLCFNYIELGAGESHEHLLTDQETAVTPLSGRATLTLGDQNYEVSRTSVFEELAPIGYAPPGTPITVTAIEPFTFAIGSATTDARSKAKLQGYTGDSCSECGNYTMVRNGSPTARHRDRARSKSSPTPTQPDGPGKNGQIEVHSRPVVSTMNDRRPHLGRGAGPNHVHGVPRAGLEPAQP